MPVIKNKMDSSKGYLDKMDNDAQLKKALRKMINRPWPELREIRKKVKYNNQKNALRIIKHILKTKDDLRRSNKNIRKGAVDNGPPIYHCRYCGKVITFRHKKYMNQLCQYCHKIFYESDPDDLRGYKLYHSRLVNTVDDLIEARKHTIH